jgi:asparagine synthase (glutamine-hydrolysing)
MKEISKNLKDILSNTVRKSAYKGLLFSGGLDSSIVASINPKITAITVSLESEGEDIHYSELLAKSLNIKHIFRKVEIDEAIESIPRVIKILKSFDPVIPNDLAVFFGLSLAKELGIDEIASGDGSDELFGGYSFMEKIDDLESYIQRISEKMSFSSNELCESFGIKIIQPFMNRDVIDFALQIPADLKIKKHNGEVWGKWILRRAFENLLPPEIIWQDKRPLEYGSGMTKLRKTICSKISDDEFEEKKKIYPINFLNKEHLYYYEIYRKEVGKIPTPRGTQKRCLGCDAGMELTAFHCKVCGHVLNWRIR